MPLDYDTNQRARLEMNARHHKHNDTYERVLEMYEKDRDRYDRLPNVLKSEAWVYANFRQSYRDAVRAGVVTDDRGPDAA